MVRKICINFDEIKDVDASMPTIKAIIDSYRRVTPLEVLLYSRKNINPFFRTSIRKYLLNKTGVSAEKVKALKLPIFKPSMAEAIDATGILYWNKKRNDECKNCKCNDNDSVKVQATA